MFAYGIGVIPMIKKLKTEHPDITQTLNDDDVGALGTSGNIELYFNLIKNPARVMGITINPPKVFLL